MSYPPPSQLLPHTGCAVLIDEIVHDTRDTIEVAARMSATHPFFVPSRGVPTWVGIEMMAQAIALHSGLSAQRSAGGEPRHGMLLGTRHFQAHVPWFVEDARLLIHAAREFGQTGGLAACACRIDTAGRTLAEATIIVIEMEAAP